MKRFFVMVALAALLGFGSTGCLKEGLMKVNGTNVVNVKAPEELRVIDGIVYMELDYVDAYRLDDMEAAMYWMVVNGYDQMVLTMCNPGGSIFHMWAILDLLQQGKDAGLKLDTYATGLIASAAVPIFLMGENRTISKNSYVMIHPHSGYISPNNPETVNKMFKQWNERYAKIIADRTKMSYDEAMMHLTTGNQQTYAFFMDAVMAKLKGFVHEIK